MTENKEHKAAINSLLLYQKSLTDDKAAKEKELVAVENKLAAINTALDILREEAQQETMVVKVQMMRQSNGKYGVCTGPMQGARTWLEDNDGKKFTSTQIAKALKKGGYPFKGKMNSLNATISGALRRLHKQGKIEKRVMARTPPKSGDVAFFWIEKDEDINHVAVNRVETE